MARTRTIKPEFWDDEKLPTCSRDARLVYIGCWTYSDDYGVVKGSATWLKSKILPYDDISPNLFRKWLSELEKLHCLLPFRAKDEQYYYIRNFLKHQTIDKPSKVRNPPPPDEILAHSRALDEPSASTRRGLDDETETETETERETEKKQKQEPPYVEIVADLNEVLGLIPPHGYKTDPVSKEIVQLINRRYEDGYNIEHFRIVHRTMYQAWHNDPKMERFIRPQTLYTEKFSSYLNYLPSRSAQGIMSAATERSLEIARRWEESKGEQNAGLPVVCE